MQDMGKSKTGGRAFWPWVGGALAGVAVAGAIWFVATRGSGPIPASSEITTATAPAAPDPVPAAEPPAATGAVAPSFDTVRAESDGSVLIAGVASPAATVRVLVDGVEVGTGAADAQGKFATFLNLGASEKPRVLTLMAEGADGKDLTSAANVILAPTPAPEPAPEPAPAEVAADAVSPTEPAEPTAAAASPDVLVADAEGVTKQTPDAPVAEMIIDTIGYDALGNVDIAGRGAVGAFAWLYIDNALAGTAPLTPAGKWRIKLTGIDAGLHTLRVDQLDEAGKVTSRVETPFQREAVEKVATATPEPATEATVPEATVPEATVPEATATEATATAEPVAPPPVKEVTITVQPGFTLWAIASQNYGDGMLYVRVFQANKDQIRDPDLIYPGQVFKVPTDASGG